MTVPRRTAVLLAAVLLSPALPSLAATAPVTVVAPVVRDAVLGLGTTTASLTDEQLLGVTWASGTAAVRTRWLTASGWTPWQLAEQDTGDADAEPGATRPGTDPLWRPAGATAAQVQVTGTPRGLRLVRVSDGAARTHRQWGAAPASATPATGLLGEVASRADWGADESMRSGRPSYASRVSAVVVHHTAGRNGYSPAEVPSIIRADYAYHVRARGWSDLGYNLVVDRFGRIWQGRAGGVTRATVGAHAQGFNTGTLGVSVLGDYTRAPAPPAALRALSRVVAFAAATWRFDPQSTVVLRSGGSPRYARGRTVRLSRVFGHKETGQTACPGVLQDHLGEVRRGAAMLLGPAPRVLSVTVAGAPVHAPTPLQLTGRLSQRTPWRVALRNADDEVVAQAAGDSATARLAWDGLAPLPAAVRSGSAPSLVPALPGSYTWTVVADDGFHPVSRRSGTVQVGLPLVPAG